MSMSTGDVRRPSLTKLSKAAAADGPEPEVLDTDEPEGKRPAKAKAETESRPGARSAAKAATRSTANRPAGKTGAKAAGRGPAKMAGGGGKGRKPVKAVKVSHGRNWGPVLMFTATGLVAVLIIGFAAFQLIKKANAPSWQQRAAGISGIHDYLVSNPDWFKYGPEGNHKTGVLTYPIMPPVGGVHAPYWQNCMGDVYTSQIAKEQAVHSLEHGAVWVAYRPDLPKDQVDKLASKVRDKSFMLMSPFPGLDAPISLQAWGYQIKVDNASDDRIDEFIGALRQNATQEPQATCSGGITDATADPLNLTPPQQGTGG